MTDKKIDWKQAAEYYYHVAVWFATHDPGEPVPDWCFLAWPINIETMNELILLRQEELEDL